MNSRMSKRRMWLVAVSSLAMACSDGTSPAEETPNWFVFAASLPTLSGPHLFVVRSDGSGKRQLTSGASINGTPVWSPDARQIAFVSDPTPSSPDAPRFQLYVMEADGSGTRRLTRPDDGVAEGGISWSPDGQRIVFGCRPVGATTNRLCIIGASGSGFTELLPAGWQGMQPAWSPDGSTIAFAGTAPGASSTLQIFTTVPAGGTPRALTNELGHQMQPTWAPDGTLLAVSTRSGQLAFGSELVTMRADGSGRATIYPNGFPRSYFEVPTWSRDGKRIGFLRVDFDADAQLRFYIANRDGSGIRPFPVMNGANGGWSWGLN